MQRYFIFSLKSATVFDGLRQWLAAFDSEHRTETDCRINFIRTADCYCKLTVIPDDRHYETILHECAAFGDILP